VTKPRRGTTRRKVNAPKIGEKGFAAGFSQATTAKKQESKARRRATNAREANEKQPKSFLKMSSSSNATNGAPLVSVKFEDNATAAAPLLAAAAAMVQHQQTTTTISRNSNTSSNANNTTTATSEEEGTTTTTTSTTYMDTTTTKESTTERHPAVQPPLQQVTLLDDCCASSSTALLHSSSSARRSLQNRGRGAESEVRACGCCIVSLVCSISLLFHMKHGWFL